MDDFSNRGTSLATISVTAAMSGTYAVTVTASGCATSSSVSVVVNAAPAAPSATTPVSYCHNAAAVPLTATATSGTGNTLNWYTTATGGTASNTAPMPLTSTVGTTTYYVSQVNTGTPCESPRTAVVVTVVAVPSISGSSTNPTTCTSTNGTIVLSGLTPNTSYTVKYTKNGGAPVTINLTSTAGGVVTITGLSAGSYTDITATRSGCSSNIVGPFTLTTPSAPSAPTAGSNSPLCAGSTLNLTSSTTTPGVTYLWSGPGGFSSTQQNPTRSNVTAAMSGTYAVTVTASGCATSSSVSVVVNAAPAAPSATTPVSYCHNTAAVLLTATATSGNTLNWYTTATGGTASSTAPTPLTSTVGTTTYYVSQVNASTPCESPRTAVLVTVVAVPSISGSSTNPTTCTSTNGTIVLNGLTSNTTYAVKYTKNGGTPVTINLTSTAGGVVTITGLSAGSYTEITATRSGCSSNSIGPFTLTTPSAPAAPTVGSNSPLCASSTLNLTSSTTTPGVTYSWSGPGGYSSTQQNPTRSNVTTAMNGTYAVTVTASGCTSSSSVSVEVNATATPTVSNNGPLCTGGNLNLVASSSSAGVISYVWTGPNGFSSTLQNPVISNVSAASRGVYKVVATSDLGNCPSAEAASTVVVSDIPAISGSSFTNPINCNPTSGTISLSGLLVNTTYVVRFIKNAGSQSTISGTTNANGTLIITGLSGGTYSNISVTINGCTSNMVGPYVLVDAFELPSTPKATSNSPLCIGSTLNLAALSSTSGVTYTWTDPNGFTSGLQNANVSNVTLAAAGKYYVTAKLNNCTSEKDSVTVLIGDYPKINLGPDLTLSPGIKHQLSPSISNGPITNYIWSPTTNLSCSNCPNPTITIESDITYIVEVVNSFGCRAKDTINIKATCDKAQVYIPDAFTPDGDGVNDVFMVRASGTITVKYFRIFNRWGEMVFEKNNVTPNNPQHGWDGKVKGVVGGPDVFVYTADVMCPNGSRFVYKGNVSILK